MEQKEYRIIKLTQIGEVTFIYNTKGELTLFVNGVEEKLDSITKKQTSTTIIKKLCKKYNK